MKTIKRLSDYFEMQLLMTSLIVLAIFLISVRVFAQVPVIKADGSSTVFPIAEAVAEEFQKEQKGKIRVTVGISGTGGGFKKFCRGETDFQNASRPIQASEMEACKTAGIKYFELPIGYDAMVVVVNPKNKWLNEISVVDLKKIWEPSAQGKITKWNQINSTWPDKALKLYGAGSDSGTFDYFTEAIVGKAKSSRGDYTASEDDNTLVNGVSSDEFSIGYIPLSYFEENKGKLKALGVISGKGKAVLPSKTTVENGTYFPLSRPLFIYVSEASIKKPEVQQFTTFLMTNAKTLVPQVKYIALPGKIYEQAQDLVKKGKVGTKFGGHAEVGMKLDDFMKKEGRL